MIHDIRRYLLGVVLVASGFVFNACSDDTPVGPGTPAKKPIVIGAASVDFGALSTTNCKDTTLSFTNNTGKTVHVHDVEASGHFVASTNYTFPLEFKATDTLSVKITYCPTAEGASSGVLSITGVGGDSTIVTLSGNGERPKPLLTGPASIDFGAVAKGDCKDTSIRYDNTTGNIITISTLNFSNAAFKWNGASLPTQLQSGQSLDIRVRFCPEVLDTATGTLQFTGTGGDVVTIALTGYSNEVEPRVGSSYTFQKYDTDASGAKVEGTDRTVLDIITATDIDFQGRSGVYVVTSGTQSNYFVKESNGDISTYFSNNVPYVASLLRGWIRLPYGSKQQNITLVSKDTTVIVDFDGIDVPTQMQVRQIASYAGSSTITIDGKSYEVLNVTLTTSINVDALIISGVITTTVRVGYVPALGYQSRYEEILTSTLPANPNLEEGGSVKTLTEFDIK